MGFKFLKYLPITLKVLTFIAIVAVICAVTGCSTCREFDKGDAESYNLCVKNSTAHVKRQPI